MKLLITGGAGYIGSHMTKFAQEQGHEVVVLDNFSTGHEWAISDCEIIKVDLVDRDQLAKSLKKRSFDGVIHFAGSSLVEESLTFPNLYYRNNIIGSLNLVDELVKNNINNLVFSSSAAVYGHPITSKINENHPTNPINPYGKSKLMIENILEDICKSFDFNATCLRYFNAAGAHESGLIGEAHYPETHLIPNIFNATFSKNKTFEIFGKDYSTRDGTCIRDYVHVTDLAAAHMLAIQDMKNNKDKNFNIYNVGSSNGFSILEVFEGILDITNTDISFEFKKKREGDPEKLIADIAKIKKELKWEPKYGSLKQILMSAWNWHKNLNSRKE